MLNNRISPGTEASAQKKVGDIFTATSRLIDKIIGAAVARSFASNGKLGKARVLPGNATITVIKLELYRSAANRLSNRRAVENDIRHRVTAQKLGRTLSHDPADGIDDVGFAAAVWPDDTDQVSRNGNGYWINEGFEPSKLYILEVHSRFSICAFFGGDCATIQTIIRNTK